MIRAFKSLLQTASRVWLLVAGLALVVVALLIWFSWPGKPATYHLKLTAGSKGSRRYNEAKVLIEEARKERLIFELSQTSGSEESLDLVDEGKIDVALVQGGIRLRGRDNIREVGLLNVEPLHVLVQKDHIEKARENPAYLKGKRLNLSEKGSGTYLLAREFLRFTGWLDEDGQQQFQEMNWGYADIDRRLHRIVAATGSERDKLIAELPDAAFVVSSLPAPIVSRMVRIGGYRLLPLEFAEAFLHEPFDELIVKTCPIAKRHMLVSKIPRGIYSVNDEVPPESCQTIAARLLVVANKNVPAEVVERFLHVLYEGPLKHRFPSPTLDKIQPEYELHEGVIEYLAQRQNVMQKFWLSILEQIAAFGSGIAGAIVAAWGYFRYRRLLRFEYYFHEVRRLEAVARGKEDDPDAPTDPHNLELYLQNQLADLRDTAVAELATGKLFGEALVLPILLHISQAAEAIPRLVAYRQSLLAAR